MRIGLAVAFAVMFLVVTWIGLGFLLSDNMNAHQALTQAQQQLNQVVEEKKAIQDQLDTMNSENATLRQQNEVFANQTTLLQEQAYQLQSENDALKYQISDLKAQLDEMTKLNIWISRLARIVHQPSLFALFVPFLPASLVASYVIYHHNQRRSNRKRDQQGRPTRTLAINITEEEMQQIVKARRGY